MNVQRSLSTLNTTTEVPWSKAPNPQLLPGRHSINGCPLLRVCVHGVCVFVCSLLCGCTLDGLNAEHKFRIWVMSLSLSLFTYLPGQPVPPLLPLGYLTFFANIVLSSGLQKGYGANHKILLTLIYFDQSSLTSLLMSPLLKGHSIMTKLTIRLTLACSLKHFSPSFVPLLPLLHQL